jgi:hypothetical protein
MMGGDVFLDPRTGLNHVGHYTFKGNIRKLFGNENAASRRKREEIDRTEAEVEVEEPKAQVNE